MILLTWLTHFLPVLGRLRRQVEMYQHYVCTVHRYVCNLWFVHKSHVTSLSKEVMWVGNFRRQCVQSTYELLRDFVKCIQRVRCPSGGISRVSLITRVFSHKRENYGKKRCYECFLSQWLMEARVTRAVSAQRNIVVSYSALAYHSLLTTLREVGLLRLD